jgi:SIR2-like domain
VASLLLGAGFSRTWGGWLGQEILGELLGRLVDAPDIYRRLRTSGDFESVFGDLRQDARTRGTQEAKHAAERMEGAIIEVFGEMNRAFSILPSLELSQDRAYSPRLFLSLFDEIFTLNQDLLLEVHYQAELGNRGWVGTYFPGVVPPPNWPNLTAHERILGAWHPAEQIELHANAQPIFKLHGSVNWREADGARLLVMGTGKDQAIGGSRLLTTYFDQFRARLMSGNAKLMIIGYGFADQHINSLLIQASRERGLQIYLLDPRGLAIFEPAPSAQIRLPSPFAELRITGVSTRTLDAVFRGDSLQLESLMRFAA